MPNLANTLYPPSIPTFQAAFVYNQPVKVLFSLSPFNTNVDSATTKVHVSCTDQATNENALGDPQGIILRALSFDEETGSYYVSLSPSDLKGENDKPAKNFKINQYYKVQVRFDNSSVALATYNSYTSAQKQDYLLNQQEYFSEWSSVSLIRPILPPTVVLREFDVQGTGGQNTTPGFNKGIIPINGRVYWDLQYGEDGGSKYSNDETDTLNYYKLEILDEDGEEVYLSTENIYTGNSAAPNEVNYRFDSQGIKSNDLNYILRFTGTTRNQYTWVQEWPFQIFEYISLPEFDPVITVDIDNDDGYAKLHVYNDHVVFGTLYIKRSDNLSNYTKWEDIYVVKVGYEGKFEGEIDIEYIDRTVGSMVWYRYSVQLETDGGSLTQLYRSDKFLTDFYDLFLVRGDRQIGIRFNYNVTSLKPNVSRTKFDTLGGKYPKFAENALLDYKQLSISGMISAQEDGNQQFLNKREYFGDQYNAYVFYNNYYPNRHFSNEEDEESIERWKPIPEDYDYFWEREFREQLVEWLNDGYPKLYKSKTEGSLVVMLTDINLTPQASLSRRLWNFTATAYEVEDATSIETLAALGIVDPYKDYDESAGTQGEGGGGQTPYSTTEKPGQLYEWTPNMNTDIIDGKIVKDLEWHYGGYLDDVKPRDVTLRNVRIMFNSPPHMFVPGGGEGNQALTLITPTSYQSAENTILGHQVVINGKRVFVNQGYYQVPDGVVVSSISFPQGDLTIGKVNNTSEMYSRRDKVTIDYIVNYRENSLVSDTPTSTRIEKTIVAQLMDTFDYEEYLFSKIKRKHTFIKQGEYKIELQYWMGICVDVDPYAIVSVKYHRDDDYNDYLVGSTGVLHMIEDTPADNICFKGRQMFDMPMERQPYLKDYEFCLDDGEYERYTYVDNPKNNVVYKCANGYYIYYHHDWYPFDLDKKVAKVPIEGCLNYFANLFRSEY